MDSLHKAVRDRNHDRLEELLRSGMCDINQKNDKGETPLEIAVFLGDFCATKLLLDFGAEPILQADSLTQDTGIRGGKTVVIRELINRGCHPDRITYPPHRATDTIWNMVIEMNDPDLLQRLLQSAEREIHDDDWSNALLFTACAKGSYRIVEYLISCKLPLDNKDAEGRSALFYAVLGGDIRTFKLLMDNGANLHQLDKNGANLMHYAVESINHHDFVQLLLENNVDVNVCSKYNGMPLHHAIYRNWLFTINSLVENNANISRGDLYGRNPFVAAIDIDWGIADYSCMNYLLSQKSLDINQVDLEGQTALHHAVIRGNVIVVQQLLYHRDTEVNIQDYHGRTPLNYAIDGNYLTILELLLDFGASVSCLYDYPRYEFLKTDVKTSLMKYMIKREVADLQIENSLRTILCNEQQIKKDCKYFRNVCIKEVELLKTMTMDDGEITYYQFLHGDRDRLHWYTNKPNIRGIFENHMHYFTEYVHILGRNYILGIRSIIEDGIEVIATARDSIHNTTDMISSNKVLASHESMDNDEDDMDDDDDDDGITLLLY